MKMIRAIVRPEKEESVVKSLETAGFPAITKCDVTGRGKHIIDRCNLTVLLLPNKTHLPKWLADRGVEIIHLQSDHQCFGSGE